MTDIDVLQGVVVHEVTVDGTELHVDIYGSTANICGTVRFTFQDPGERRAMAQLLERWGRESTPLTYIETGSSIALQDDEAVFGNQLPTTPRR